MADEKRLGGPVTRLIVRAFVPKWDHAHLSAVRVRIGLFTAALGMVANAVLIALFAGVGLAIASLALIAAALDALGDLLMGGVGFIGFKASGKKADPDHPYGHERAEEIAAITVATILVIVAVQFAYEATRRYLRGDVSTEYTDAALIVVAIAMVVKILLSVFTIRVGRYIDSLVLTGTAWNYFIDVLSAFLAGVAVLARRQGVAWVDPVVAVLIALLVIRVGVRLFRQASDGLLGRGASLDLRERIHKEACNVAGVVSCSDIEVHFYGTKRRVNLRIQVPDTMTLRQAHEAAEEVQRRIHALHADWHPIVHVGPVRLERPGPASLE